LINISLFLYLCKKTKTIQLHLAPQISDILQLTNKMNVDEKQNLLWLMFQAIGQNFFYKTINIPNRLLCILTNYENNNSIIKMKSTREN